MLVVGHALANLADGYGGPQDPEVLYSPEDVAGDLAGLEIERAEFVRVRSARRTVRRRRSTSSFGVTGPETRFDLAAAASSNRGR